MLCLLVAAERARCEFHPADVVVDPVHLSGPLIAVSFYSVGVGLMQEGHTDLAWDAACGVCLGGGGVQAHPLKEAN